MNVARYTGIGHFLRHTYKAVRDAGAGGRARSSEQQVMCRRRGAGRGGGENLTRAKLLRAPGRNLNQ
ncbi:hypothetical protein EVAR_58045_1 [Eumeta japonica]|uniref:Uncharacterized protein n=1 Tax=Eumeta variegata TaxID=151549 RepID=A0A4C1Z3K5_EUMVA|nr:hypothetical protein EVAR_58045_1 [Eumeta japonica]